MKGNPVKVPDAVAPSVDPRRTLNSLQLAIGGAVVGQDRLVKSLAVALVAGGHVLLEGVPGLAKTYLVRTFAKTLHLEFRRIQFTPDMLPADVMGVIVLNPKTQGFEFRPGPIFANVILADEINRAPPKVQSALLEAMQERQVTMEGHTYPLPSPFIVIATQNPVEQEGTYPLPEAELDRLLFRLIVDYPSEEDEVKLLSQRAGETVLEPSTSVVESSDIDQMQEMRRTVFVNADVISYLAGIIRSTRVDPRVLIGASPRAGVQFLNAVKALALFEGRDYVVPDDVRSMVVPALNHRITLSPEVLAMQEGSAAMKDSSSLYAGVINSIVSRVPTPR